MSKNVVIIPNVTEEDSIGFIFSHLIHVIHETEASDDVQWDFTDVNKLHPFFIAPLAIYKNTSSKQIDCTNMSLQLQSYLNGICFDRMLHFGDEKREDIEDILHNYDNKNFIPLCSFDMTDSNKDTFGSLLKNALLRQVNFEHNGNSSISYLISELLDNIYEHSNSPSGYIFSQYNEKEKVIHLCIADSGITIAGSFKNAKLYQKEIDGNEAEALKLANEGYSTKNRPSAENRGYGISTSKSMLVSGMKGAFYMLSGEAFHHYRDGKNAYINLKNIFRWNGTIILMSIPTKLPKTFNYINYLE